MGVSIEVKAYCTISEADTATIEYCGGDKTAYCLRFRKEDDADVPHQTVYLSAEDLEKFIKGARILINSNKETD